MALLNFPQQCLSSLSALLMEQANVVGEQFLPHGVRNVAAASRTAGYLK